MWARLDSNQRPSDYESEKKRQFGEKDSFWDIINIRKLTNTMFVTKSVTIVSHSFFLEFYFFNNFFKVIQLICGVMFFRYPFVCMIEQGL